MPELIEFKAHCRRWIPLSTASTFSGGDGSDVARSIPWNPLPDSTLAFLAEGYPFARTKLTRFGEDAFACRFMLQRVVFICGPDAARLFSDSSQFRRAGIAPRRILKALLGEGGVHGLDGPSQRHRKGVFLSVMRPECLGPFRSIIKEEWAQAVTKCRQAVHRPGDRAENRHAGSEKRVDEAFAAAVRVADQARQAAVLAGLVTATAMLIGLAAWYAARNGGRHRDNNIPAKFSVSPGLPRRRTAPAAVPEPESSHVA